MIPRTIYYCWFGGKKLPKLAKKCIKSWRKYAPDFKIIEINKTNFEINSFLYSKQAYDFKKWAFVSDVARIVTLYENGGIYFDTDYELLKPIDNLLEYDFFTGYEDNSHLGFGFFGTSKGNVMLKMLVDDYKNRHFVVDSKLDLTTIGFSFQKCVNLSNFSFQKVMLLERSALYPSSKKEIEEAYGIHHYEGSWLPKKIKFQKVIGPKMTKFLVKLKRGISK